MAKQLNVSLAFNADVSQAQKAIQNLQTSLSKISAMKVGDNLQLKEASEAARMLSYHLNQAYNATTGNIDLSALNHSLQKSSTNVTQLSNKLLQAGQTGQQAFVNLAQAISTAEYPMFKLGKRLTEFGNTLKNTIRWQFSSSLIHGMMGAYQQAIGYAEDLNQSLTNIRVVTGNNVEEMARFAEYANKAAKSLSTTTTAYTDAALIFYQQGLNDEQVKTRTDITVQMANVTGQSVTTVSDQLTAIWNNFNKSGDVAYEHYADVLTALGAATASSTDEIAGGLEKFAAVADTIGLSYEYAAAALATITSNTRQSEEVVGTALKTIFARIQGLNLGETLDDGTTLNKYSEALEKVGISIFDSAGEMKKMDVILDEMGAKWQTLSQDQQVALAQTVAGVRQYNQLVSLMDNWNDGDSDSMMSNLNTALTADGALEEQADIWAESWEAAEKRVKAAAEGVYDSILDDDLFIGFNNVFADMLTGLEQVIDGVGGLKGVFIGVGSFILSLISHKIQPALTGFVLNIKSMFQSAQTQAAALTGELRTKVSTEINKTGDNAYDASQRQSLKNASDLAEARTRLTVVSKNLTEQEKMLYQFDISLMEQDAKKAQYVADEIAALERERDAIYMSVDATQEKILVNETYEKELQSLLETQEMNRQLYEAAYAKPRNQEQQKVAGDEYLASRQAVDEYITSYQTLHEIMSTTTQATMAAYEAQDKMGTEFVEGSQVLEGFISNLLNMTTGMSGVNRALKPDEIDSYKRQLDLLGKTLSNMKGISADTQKELSQLFAKAKTSKGTVAFSKNIEKITQKLGQLKFTSQQLKDLGISLSPSQFKKFIANLELGKKKEEELLTIQQELTNKLNNFNPSHMISGLERLTSAASAMGSVAMMGQSISSMINSWSNADLSFGEKLSTTFMSLSMLIPGTISAIKGLNTALQGTALQQTLVSAAMKLTTKDSTIAAAKTILLTTAKNADMTADKKRIVTMGAAVAAMQAEGLALDKNKRAYIARLVAQKVANGATKEEIATFLASKLGIDADTAAKIANKIATDSLKTSIMGLLGPIALIIAAVTAVVAAFTAWNKAQEEAAKWDAEQNQEQVDKIMERVDALRTERQEFEALMKAYEDAKANQDGTAAAQQAIADATWDICEALGIEIDLIDKLQGKVDGYDSKIYEQGAADALDEIKEFQENWNDIDKNFYTQYRDVANTIKPNDYTTGDTTLYATNSISKNWYDENGVTYSPDYGYSAGGLGDSADEAFRTGLADYLSSSDFKYTDKMTFSNNMIVESGEGAMQFKGGVSAAEQYQIISDMVSYMSNYLTVDQQKNSEMFKWYEALVDAGENTLNDKNEATTEVEAQIQKYAANQTQVDTQMSYDQVKTYEQYLAVRDAFVENLRTGYSEAGLDIDYSGFETAEAYLESIAEKFLLAEPAIAEVKGIDQISKDNPNLPKDQLEILYEQYKDVFFVDASINFDEIKSITELENILKALQAKADASKIQTKIDIVNEAAKNLSNDISLSDYAAFETESKIKWGQQDNDLGKKIIEYNEFLAMSYQDQVAYLDSLSQQYNEAQLKNINTTLSAQKALLQEYKTEYEALENKTMNAQELARYMELETLIAGLESSIPQLAGTANIIIDDTLSQAESLAELHNLILSLSNQNITIDYGSYGEALTNLASKYETCANESARFNMALRDMESALASGDQTLIDNAESVLENAQNTLEASIMAGEMAEKYNINAEAIERYAEEIQNANTEMQYSDKALVQMAKDQLRFDKAVNNAAENMEDWTKDLKVAEKTGHLVSETAEEMAEAYGDLLDIDGSQLSADFLNNTEHLEDMKKALEGDEEAYQRLQEAARIDIATKVGFDDSEFQAGFNDLMSTYYEGQSLEDLVVGADLDNADFLNALSEMVTQAGMTAQEATDYLSSMGVDAEVVTKPETVTETVGYNMIPTIKTVDGPYGLGSISFSGVEYTQEPVTQEKQVTGTALEVTSASKSSGGNVKSKGSTAGNGGSNSKKGGGGGGGKPKKADKVKKSDVVERYKEINDQLEETQHLMSKTSAEAEGLWGEARFKKMREGVELLKRENQQLKERMKWSKDYVDEDRTALNAAAAEAGISFQYDPKDGYITNYTEQMTWLYNQLDNAINSANADGNATEEEQEKIDKWQKYIDDIESARGDYEDALAQWREDEEKWLENRNKIWQDNFDILSEELELKVQLNTQDLEVLQYFLDKIEDAVYGIAEAFASGKYFEQQFANYSANLGLLSNETGNEDTQGFYQNLQDQYRNGDIGLVQYKQGLADMMGMTIENLENLQDLKDSMQEFYGDVLEKALEEIAIYTDSMENLNSVLDHYSNILELVGKQDDYASKNKVLSSKAKNLRNEIDVQKRLYEESAADAEYWAQKMNEAEVGSNEYETYKKNWQAAEAAAQESQDAMLAKTEEWAEAMKSIIENELAEFADILEKSLTGGVSFDELMTSMERRSSLQEEYLTTTNKIYETNKLMRTAQQEIDKTSNTAAKRRMAQFISETQQLQNKNKLSQYELDIQQAKYDLLLAEIALEEAQDAKSVVRLQRDAEGNFGYVYTADQNAVADAEQQLADAQNNLYNIGLEGANNYQQKYAETLQESQEAITELTQMWMNGEISSEEEFNRRKQEIVEYYGEKLQQYSDLHSIALTTDSRVVKDAWSSDFTSMTASVDVWKQNVDTYFSQAGESMKDWADICAQTLEDSGLDDMDKTLGDIDQKSKDLKNTLIGEDGKSGVVAAMMAEVDAAGKLSEEYISIQDAIDGVIAEYEELLKILNEDYQSPNGPGDEEGKQNGNENDGEEENNDNNQNDDNNETPPPTAELSVGSTVKVKTSASKWASGEGIWGPVKGNNFKVMQISGEKVLIGDPCGPNYTASGVTGWIKKTDLEGFDTGGYTGDWSGAYGKLALLHKKELILKEGDTANFLAGMDLLNKIISVIDLQSVNNSLGGLLSSPSLGHVGDEGGILEQQVHIEASFPGVSDHSEIEEAFNNLVNQAAQYANRK